MAVMFVLAIACTNVMNLLLAHAADASGSSHAEPRSLLSS